jgi:hypothetical protein
VDAFVFLVEECIEFVEVVVVMVFGGIVVGFDEVGVAVGVVVVVVAAVVVEVAIDDLFGFVFLVVAIVDEVAAIEPVEIVVVAVVYDVGVVVTVDYVELIGVELVVEIKLVVERGMGVAEVLVIVAVLPAMLDIELVPFVMKEVEILVVVD